MTAWTTEELDTIASECEVQIAPLGPNGSPIRPVTVWVVRVRNGLYVRSWRGQDGGWFAAAQQNRAARIHVRGLDRDVRLMDAPPDIYDAVDAAYRNKYAQSAYVEDMVGPEARATTLQLLPRVPDYVAERRHHADREKQHR